MNTYAEMSDSVIRREGLLALQDKLGYVGAERFISLIIREPFDYTKWQRNLFNDVSLEELAENADAYSETLINK